MATLGYVISTGAMAALAIVAWCFLHRWTLRRSRAGKRDTFE